MFSSRAVVVGLKFRSVKKPFVCFVRILYDLFLATICDPRFVVNGENLCKKSICMGKSPTIKPSQLSLTSFRTIFAMVIL